MCLSPASGLQRKVGLSSGRVIGESNKPIRGATQTWLALRHRYGILGFFPQTPVRGKLVLAPPTVLSQAAVFADSLI